MRRGDTQFSQAVQEHDLQTMKEAVRNGVKRLKMKKALGICWIVPEMLKAGGEVMIEWMVNAHYGVESQGSPLQLEECSYMVILLKS